MTKLPSCPISFPSFQCVTRSFSKSDILPPGSIPKDGPSAGVTLVTTLVSLPPEIARAIQFHFVGRIAEVIEVAPYMKLSNLGPEIVPKVLEEVQQRFIQ